MQRARSQQKTGCAGWGGANAKVPGGCASVPPAALAAQRGIDRPVSSRAGGPGRWVRVGWRVSQHPSLELGRPGWSGCQTECWPSMHCSIPITPSRASNASSPAGSGPNPSAMRPPGPAWGWRRPPRGRPGAHPVGRVGPPAFACRPATRGRARATPHLARDLGECEVGLQAVRERPIKGPIDSASAGSCRAGTSSRQAVRVALPTWLAPRVQNSGHGVGLRVAAGHTCGGAGGPGECQSVDEVLLPGAAGSAGVERPPGADLVGFGRIPEVLPARLVHGMGEKVHKVETLARWPQALGSPGRRQPEKHGVVGPGTLAEHGGKRVGRGHSVHGRGASTVQQTRYRRYACRGGWRCRSAAGGAQAPVGVGDQAERAGGSGRRLGGHGVASGNAGVCGGYPDFGGCARAFDDRQGAAHSRGGGALWEVVA